MEKSLRPVASSERISSLDFLRGIALCGILIPNVVYYGLPHDHPEIGNATTLNIFERTVSSIAIWGTMRALFCMLFGAGVVLLTDKAKTREDGQQTADIYYRRLLWLMLLGLVHYYLLLGWQDILYAYAMVGLGLYPFRKTKPFGLLFIGMLILLLFGVPPQLISHQRTVEMHAAAVDAEAALASGALLTDEQEEARQVWKDKLSQNVPDEETLQQKIVEMQAGYWDHVKRLIRNDVAASAPPFYFQPTFWDYAGAMFLGMGLFKLGVFSGTRPRRFYLALVIVGYGVGLPFRGYEAYLQATHDYNSLQLLDYWYVVGPWSVPCSQVFRICVTLGHVGVLMLMCQAGWLSWFTMAMAAVGQMALSNYILQTVVCTWLFNGYGFGLFGKLERYQMPLIVIGTWILSVVFSVIWLKYFRFGPVEWLWRSLTYGTRQPVLLGRSSGLQ